MRIASILEFVKMGIKLCNNITSTSECLWTSRIKRRSFILDRYSSYIIIIIIYRWCFKRGMFDRHGESLVILPSCVSLTHGVDLLWTAAGETGKGARRRLSADSNTTSPLLLHAGGDTRRRGAGSEGLGQGQEDAVIHRGRGKLRPNAKLRWVLPYSVRHTAQSLSQCDFCTFPSSLFLFSLIYILNIVYLLNRVH